MDRKPTTRTTKSGLTVLDGYQWEEEVIETVPPVEPPPEVETRTPAPRWYVWVIPGIKHNAMWQMGRAVGYASLSDLKADQRVAIAYQKNRGATVLALRADLDTVL